MPKHRNAISCRVLLWTFTLSILALTPASGQLVLHVDRTEDFWFESDCDDAVADDCSLRGAILHANSLPLAFDVEIEIPAGVYELIFDGPGEDAGLFGDLDITRSMVLRGQGRYATVIHGGETVTLDDRLLEVHAPDLEVGFESLGFAAGGPPSGLHSVFVNSTSSVAFVDCSFVNHGNAVTGGGALRLAYGVPFARLNHCTFEGNRSTANGAAISSAAEQLIVAYSSLENNQADVFGGAIFLEPPGPGLSADVNFGGSTFVGNQAYRGGGAYASAGVDLYVPYSTFRDNHALLAGPGDGSGGAIYSLSDLTVHGSTFVGNGAEDGGAAITSWMAAPPQPVVDLVNTTLSDNFGIGADRPAIYLEGSSIELLHVTSVGHAVDLGTSQANVAFQNSVLTAGCDYSLNSGTSNGGNLIPDASCWGGAPDASDQLLLVDPDLGPLAPNDGLTRTHLPGPASPLLGAAPTCVDLDQRGFSRPVANCAAGAVEPQDPEPLLFFDGFESGDVTAWSGSVS